MIALKGINFMNKLILVLSVYWIICAVPAYLSMRKGILSAWPFYLIAIVLSPFIMPHVWLEALLNKIDPPKDYSMPAIQELQGILRRDLIDGALCAIGLFTISGLNFLVMTGKL